MWTCEKCGRTFKNINQHHFCGKIESVDAYILDQPEAHREVLQKTRALIKSVCPDAVERIAWSMPTYTQGENIIHFAGAKNHMGIHPGYLENLPFMDRIKKYKHSKGSVQFPYNQDIPYDLIKDITEFRLGEAKKNHPEAFL